MILTALLVALGGQFLVLNLEQIVQHSSCLCLSPALYQTNCCYSALPADPVVPSVFSASAEGFVFNLCTFYLVQAFLSLGSAPRVLALPPHYFRSAFGDRGARDSSFVPPFRLTLTNILWVVQSTTNACYSTILIALYLGLKSK